MATFPQQVKGSNKFNASWVVDDNPRRLVIFHKNTGNTPVVSFSGWNETAGASVLSLQRLAEGLRVAGKFAASSCETVFRPRGLTLIAAQNKMADHILLAFPVFARDKDRLIINAKVWTDRTHGGSVLVWCDKITMGSLTEVAQYMQVASQACDILRTLAKKYTVK
jgi:hypothetical protein